MAAADVHHRDRRIPRPAAAHGRRPQTFIGTRNDVILLASSGSGAMEAAVSNLTSPGDKVLVLTAGKFGERLARSRPGAFGCQVELVTAEYGQTSLTRRVRAKLSPDVRAVYMQATESSTGCRRRRNRSQARARYGGPAGSGRITGLGTIASRRGRLGHRRDRRRLAEGGHGAARRRLSGGERAGMRAHGKRQGIRATTLFSICARNAKSRPRESAYTPAISVVAGLAAALDYIRRDGRSDLAEVREALTTMPRPWPR